MSKPSVFDTMMEDLFGGFSSKTVKKTMTVEESTVPKTYDSTSDDTGMKLIIDLPGIDPAGLALKVSDDKVVVTGENGHKKTFTQTYTISSDFDAKTASAQWTHGRLTVRLARRPVKKSEFHPVRIEIKS